jgi:O-antigen ligase
MNKVIRFVTLGALFLIPLLPFVVANSYFFPFITGKNFAFRILVEIAFSGWVLLALADAKYRPKFSWVAGLFVIFTAWMAIADAFGVNPAKAFWSNYERMDGWITLIHLLMLFVVMGSLFAADTLWKKWWGTFLVISGLLCIYGFGQVLHILAIHQGGVRLDATFGNSDYLACYMLFAIAISLWQLFESKQLWLRIVLGLLTVAEISILFLTATRGAILGFVAAAIFGAFLWMVESGKKGRRVAGGALLVFLVLIGGFFLARNATWIKNDPTLGRISNISLSDPETHARLTIWHMALEGFKERPVHGWGQEGFNYVFNKYYEPSLNGQEPWFDRAHNMYLDWLIAGGLPAFVLYLALFLCGVYAIYKSSLSRSERIMLLSALAAYGFQGLFVFDNLFSYIPFVAILAMAHSASSRPIKQLEKVEELDAETVNLYALPFVFVLLCIVFWFVNVPSMAAAGDLILALTPGSSTTDTIAQFKKATVDGGFAKQEIVEQVVTYAESQISSATVSQPDKQAIFTYAVQSMQDLITQIPNDARIHLEFAFLYRSAGDYNDALVQSTLASKLSPRKQSILTEEGVEQWQNGNHAAAQALFDQAYQLDTSFTDIAAYAAAGRIINGDVPGGKAILLKAFGTTTVSNDVIMLAYYQTKDNADFIDAWQQRVVRMNYSADAEFGYAEALANGGQIAAAITEVKKAIADHPDQAAKGAEILTQIASIHR